MTPIMRAMIWASIKQVIVINEIPAAHAEKPCINRRNNAILIIPARN